MTTTPNTEIKIIKVMCTYKINIFGCSYTKNKLYDARKYEEPLYNILGYSIMCNENSYFNFGQMDFNSHFIELKKLRKQKLTKISRTR
jgi:hypothetical protein